MKNEQYGTVESSFVKTEVHFTSRIATIKPVAPVQAVEASNQSQASANLVQAQVRTQAGNASALKPINLPTFSGK